MDSALFQEEEVKEESKRHNDFLNSGIGLAAFTLGLACLGTPNPVLTGWFCMPVIVALAIVATKHFPPTIQTLRDLEKETKDQHVIEVRKYLEKKYLGWRSLLTKNLLYWYGLGFFLMVFANPAFVEWLRA